MRRTLGILLVTFLCLTLNAQKKKDKLSTGAEDRAFWVKTLDKISYPVIHNLAEGTLKKNMPLETPPGGTANRYEKSSYLEAVGRTLAGVAPWLTLPDDNTTEGKLRTKYKQEILRGLAHGVNPNNPDYLNFRDGNQAIVDAAFLAQAFLRAPKQLWDPLDEVTKKRFIEEYKTLRNRSGAYNNWLLFAALNESFLWMAEGQRDPARIDFARRKILEWYAGDGWYNDGPKFSMDYYNSFVIQPMLVDLFQVLKDHKQASQAEYDLMVKRMTRYSEFLERMIAPDGSFPPFGRSITYRTGAFQALAQTAWMKKLPNHIQPSQVRSGLTAVFHKMYDGDQNFDQNGWLVLGFNGHQPEVADLYTSTGSLYMATLGFLTLGLPASDPFWADPPTDWTSKRAWNGEKLPKDGHVEY